jgi:4-hydroxythreonine-4-phosphate dehydrogenase
MARGEPREAPGVAVIGPAALAGDAPAGPVDDRRRHRGLRRRARPPDGEGSLVAWAALERAAALCLRGVRGRRDGPVSKERMAAIGWNFPGQTEFFAARWGGEPTMAFCGGRLRIALVSWHIPLRDVPAMPHRGEHRAAVAAADELARAEGVAAPRIGVCGLNPHAGEGGLIGTEERDTIDPILDGLRPVPGLSRCQPADTLFGRQLRGEFDVSVALYHDQGLAPLKAVDFDESVNVTLGLPRADEPRPRHGVRASRARARRARAASPTRSRGPALDSRPQWAIVVPMPNRPHFPPPPAPPP